MVGRLAEEDSDSGESRPTTALSAPAFDDIPDCTDLFTSAPMARSMLPHFG